MGHGLPVGKVIELFSAMGCIVGEVPGKLRIDDEEYVVRYLYCEETDRFASLSDLEDDHIIGPSEIENLERRLGLHIPYGDVN